MSNRGLCYILQSARSTKALNSNILNKETNGILMHARHDL
jgi:hypothetical protein